MLASLAGRAAIGKSVRTICEYSTCYDYVTSRAEGACYPDHLCMPRLGGASAPPGGALAPPGGCLKAEGGYMEFKGTIAMGMPACGDTCMVRW